MKKIFTLIAAVMMVATASANDVLANPGAWDENVTVEGKNYSFAGGWKGGCTYLGEAGVDKSEYDYAYVKYSAYSGASLAFKVEYNVFESEQSWGKAYKQVAKEFAAESGILAIPLDKTTKADGGGTCAQEIRQLVFQTGNDAAKITIEEVGFCTQAELDEMLAGAPKIELPEKRTDVINDDAEYDTTEGLRFGGWGGATIAIEEGAGTEGSKGYTIKQEAEGLDDWKVQGCYTIELAADTTYYLSMDVKASSNYTLKVSFQNPETYAGCGSFSAIDVTTEWQHVILKAKCTSSDAKRLLLSYGDFVGTLYFDNVILCYEGTATTGINNATATKSTSVKKSLKNGQIVITRGDKAYNAVGQEL